MKRVPLILLALLAVAAAAAFALTRGAADEGERADACPPGYLGAEQREKLERREERMMAARGYGAAKARDKGEGAGCQLRKHPEPVAELGAINANRTVRQSAPARALRPGAYAAASRSRQRAAGTRRTVPGSDGTWTPAGSSPLVNDDPNYDEVNLLGLADISGRVANFAYDGANDHLYAAVGEGGVWQSDDVGGSWRSIADNLPTQAVAAVAVAPAKDGRPATVIALTGDDIYGGGSSTPGIGAFRTTDGGATWEHAGGIPSGVLGFALAVDPTNADVVYAATGAGLYRSTDAGRTFDNVDLPTGRTGGAPNGAPLNPDCTGKGIVAGCFLANMVTDVVVQAPDTFGHAGGKVVAAVGWRAGNKSGPDGKIESPNNGIYVSDSGQRGTFRKVNPNTSGFGGGGVPTGQTNQDVIGRTELGIASGPQQNHDFLYAIVQDASAFKAGEVSGIDVPSQSPAAAPSNTYLRGVYVSGDLGQTWTRMTGPTELQLPTNGSALTPTQCAAGLYCPGIQAWYNAWIKPDPTQANASGVPTRLTFGLEEIWQNDDAPAGRQPQNGPSAFKVIGRYYAGETCQGLTQPIQPCPTNRGDPGSTTTHPDQHGGLYLPRGNGAVTLVVGNDGGAYTQTANAGQELSNTKWGRGANKGFYTLLPYDAQIAKDGVIYSGLQDNGEMKITPDGKQTGVFGGDGGFSAVDPDHSNVAWEEYTNAAISVTTDGGKTWSDASPPDDTYMFINPFTMDPNDADHLLTGGTKVYETISGPRTSGSGWTQVFDLGQEPSGAARQTSATDVRSIDTGGGQGLPTGPRTPDSTWSGGAQTQPGPTTDPGNATDPALTFFAPGTYDDHPFSVRAGAGNATMTVTISAPDPNDWDLYVYRKEGSNLVEVGRSASAGTPPEKVVIANPKAGDYIVRAHNYSASGTYDGSVTFNQRTVQTPGAVDAAYVGFCGYCEPLINRPFANGIATNVGGAKAPKALSGDGWHLAKAAGLPRRYITSIQVDPTDERTVYVTLGGYSRRWIPPGALGEDTSNVGSGHVFKSTDAGATFTDISGDLPDAPANFSLVRRGQLLVATDVGVFAARGTGGGHYDLLGNGLPTVSAYSLELKPTASDTERDQLIVATYGRGVWRYAFSDPVEVPSSTIKIGPQTGGPTACAASGGFRSVKVAPRGRGARVTFARRVRKPVSVDVFQTSRGRTVLTERLVARFSKRSRSFTWNGRANRKGRRVTDGYYFVRYRLRVDAKHEDLRRVVLRRVKGRLRLRPAFYRRASCGTLSSYKLERPVFGGRRTRKIGASFRLARAASVRVQVLRGKRVVRTFKRKAYRAGRTYRLSFSARRRPRGDYRFKLDLVRGKEKLNSTLTSRRL
jgi:hypothetical protein